MANTATKPVTAKGLQAPTPTKAALRHAVMATMGTPAPSTPVATPLPPVMVGGVQVTCAANVQRRVATLGNVGNVATINLTAGRPCRVRVNYTITAMAACMD